MQKTNLIPSSEGKTNKLNFEDLPPEKQAKINESLEIFSQILINLVLSKNMHNIDNQYIINLNKENNNIAA
jgi:hypothetical protein